jgi:hypothetical protein
MNRLSTSVYPGQGTSDTIREASVPDGPYTCRGLERTTV